MSIPLKKLSANWDYKISAKAFKELRKLGNEPAKRIVTFLMTRIKGREDPRRFGKALKGELGEFWRYRVDDYRILCRIEDATVTVLVVKIGHRGKIYD